MNEAEQNVWLAAAGLAKPEPYRKGQRVRTDDPGRVLPRGNEPHRIARERGKKVGRPVGVANGWTRADRDIEAAFARATAKLDVDYYWDHKQWPTSEESWRMYTQGIPVELWKAWVAMRKRREAEQETKDRK